MGADAKTKILLAFRSGNRCALPDCDRALSVDGKQSPSVITGQAAHIAGEKPGAARYDASMTDAQRDSYPNLIYLCGDCHTKIDKQPLDYPTDKLLAIKAAHENKVSDGVTEALSEIGFPELEKATRWLLNVPLSDIQSGFTLIPPEAKLQKNNLGPRSRAQITMGLGVSRLVRKYIESVAQEDSDFPERLRSGFLSEYYKALGEGLSGDDLFDWLCRFSQRGFHDSADKSAGVAVLVYLFEVCDVFEK
jgi:hypothetical protein